MRTAARSLRPVARSVRWGPLLGAGLAGAVLVGLMRPDRPDASASLAALRLAAFLLAAGAAFALDDRAADTLAPSPTPLWARRALRLAVVVAGAAALWAAVTAAAALAAPAGQERLPAAGATLEAAAMLAFTLAAAVVAGRWAPSGLGGVAGGPVLTFAVLTVYLGQMRWPRHLTFFPLGPGDPAWGAAQHRWSAVLALALAVLAAKSLDPARTRVALWPPSRTFPAQGGESRAGGWRRRRPGGADWGIIGGCPPSVPGW